MHRRTSLIPLIFLAAFALVACGGDGTDGGSNEPNVDVGIDVGVDAADVEPMAEHCVPDPELLDQKRRCQVDDDCPCGTACELGQCIASCSSASDCPDDQICDQFGRCRDAADEGLVPAPAEQAQGMVAIDQTQIILEEGNEAALTVTAEARAIDRVRVEARRGAEVKCAQEAAWSASCELTDLQSDDSVELTVRRSQDALQEDLPSVELFGPANSVSATLPRLDQLPGFGRVVDQTPVEVAGSYLGSIQLEAAGTDADLPDLPNAPAPTGLSVEATVWQANGQTIVAIDDPYNALTATEQFIGTISVGTDDDANGVVDGQADFVTHPFVETTVAGRTHELVVETVDAKVRSRLNPRTLSLALTQSYQGLGAQAAPTVRWVVNLQRTGETSDPAPSLPAAAELGFDPGARLQEDSPWENAFRGTSAGSSHWEMLSRVGGGSHLAHCGWDEDKLAGITHSYNNKWITGNTWVERNGYVRNPMEQVWQDAVQKAPSDITSVWARNSYAIPQTAGRKGIACGFENFRIRLERDDFSILHEDDVLDYCNDLQNRTGCQIHQVNARVAKSTNAHINGVSSGRPLYTGVTADITKVCELPPVPASCGEQISCINSDGWDAYYSKTLFADGSTTATGDLACADTDLSASIALDRLGSDLTAQQALKKCLPELATLSIGPASDVGNAPNDVFDIDAECVDVARLLAAVAVQGRSFSADALPLPESHQVRAASLIHRQLNRWVALHGFIAAESIQLEKMIDVFAETASDPGLPPIVELLETSTHGWDIFTTPHIARALMSVPDAALVEPDYRVHRFGMSGQPGAEQTQALAQGMLETLGRQGELIRLYVEKEGLTTDPEEVDPLARLMPRMLVAQTMASEMHRRAKAADPSLSWEDGYAASARRAADKLNNAFTFVAAISNGANPLGIEDEDLPLYFLADDATGEGGRFAAISDYILGTGPGSDAWAPAMVTTAQAKLSEARTAFLEESDRKVRQARSELDLERWVEDVRDDYNAKLRDYCGPLEGSLIDQTNFESATCAVNQEDPACDVDSDLWYSRWTEQDLLGRLCLHDALAATSLSDGSHGFYGEAMSDFADGCYTDAAPDSGAVSTGACAADSQAVCLRCDWKPSVAEVELDGATLELLVPDVSSYDNSEESNSEAVAGAAITGVNTGHPWMAARSTCSSKHPQMRLSVPRPDSVFETPGCVRGALGEAYLDVVAASADVDAARQAINEHNEAYDIAMDSCFILEVSNDQLRDMRDDHRENMQRLRIGRATADSAAAAAAAVKDCMSAIAGSDQSTPWGALTTGLGVAGTCAAGGVEAAANISSIGLSAEMERAQASHEDIVANIEAQTDLDICFNDAKQELVGMKMATMDLESAVFELQRVQARVNEQIADAQRVYEDGHSYLQDIEGREMPDPAGDIWAEERVNSYVRDFKLAKRATYLAVRAVEYEYQQSLGARQDVLDAEVPEDLNTVLQTLWQASGTRNINGSRPSELSVVVSLRDDILRLGDESQWPDAMRPMSLEERFELVLSSARYASYDEDGAYLGQRIPFTLAPLAELGFETGGVSLYAKTDCAERLWSVNAGIVGDGVYRGSDTTLTRIDLLKRNTFYSQWCTDPADDAPAFQRASVRPTRNLFREPGLGAPLGTDPGEQGVEAFSRARIQAFFGMDRATMEDPQYASGETSELAARGLYGDYALFIPADLISRDGANGLVLDKVDDILLRVDYLSVAAN
jgi:hypothetical protein